MRLLATIVIGTAWVLPTAVLADTPSDSEPNYINPDRPGIADGSNVVGSGRFQMEGGFQQEYRRNNGVDARTRYFPGLLRLGVDQSWEVRVEGNTYTLTTAYDSEQGGTHTEGFQPISVGLKYQFSKSAGWQRPSVGTIVRLFPPSGSGSFRTHHATGDFRIAVDWDFAPRWSLNPNLGIAAYEDDSNYLYTAGLLALTLNCNPTEIFNLFIDTGIQYPETRHGRGSAIIDGGIAYIVGRDVQLDISVGSRVAGARPARFFWAAGISKRI